MHAVHAAVSDYVNRGVAACPSSIKDPLLKRSYIDSFVVDLIRKNWPQAIIDGLGAMDIQNCLNLNPDVPNLPTAMPTGTPGVSVVTSENLVSSNELARQIEANNEKLLAAMSKMITAQNAQQAAAQPVTDPTKENN